MVDKTSSLVESLATALILPEKPNQSAKQTMEGVDIISSMPQEILHHILSFIPTQFAIRTSVLSRGWRHVWCHTPCLDFDNLNFYGEKTARNISQTLSVYRATKITSLKLRKPRVYHKHIDSWMEFVVFRNVEKLTLVMYGCYTYKMPYRFPDIFYRSSSLETLSLDYDLIPGCTVSWKSLRKLKLRNCNLYGESIDNILSGSPVLETLTLHNCKGPQRLDLSRSRSLRALDIYDYNREPTEIFDDYVERYQGPTEIVAPHIQYLSLSDSYEPFTLVDVPCLTEASLDIYIGRSYYILSEELPFSFKADIFQTSVSKMLAKLQYAETLSFGETFLQVMSLAHFRGFSFPTFKVQTLTLETRFTRSVIPGITRLLHSSPGLKKLTIEVRYFNDIKDSDIYSYLESRGLNPDQLFYSYEIFPTSDELSEIIRYEESTRELVALFVEMMLINVTTLETLVVGLKSTGRNINDAKLLEELLQMRATLPSNNNVSIVLKR